jgi:lipopolysaccharide biosynthesis glycosyltransferase
MYPNVLDKIKEMIDDNSWAKNSKVFAHDQTIVNVVFNNNDKLMIAPKYNCVKPCVLNFWYRCYGFKLVHEAHKNPYIIHFSGPLHPWHNNVLHNKFYFAWMKYKKNWLINYNKALNEK